MKILAIVDDKNTCDCCGKTPIKRAAAVELDCGDVVYYGMVCATKKHLGMSESKIKREVEKNKKIEIDRVSKLIATRHEIKKLKTAFEEARSLYRFGPKFAAHVAPYKAIVSQLVSDSLGDNVYKIRESEVL